MSDAAERIARTCEAINAHDFAVTSERELQEAIDQVLDDKGIPHQREVRLDCGGRIDFLCETIGIEVKVGGSLSDLTHQVHQYLRDPRVDGVIVVTTRARHTSLPEVMSGKPVRSLWIVRLG